MTVGELRALLANVPDDVPVVAYDHQAEMLLPWGGALSLIRVQPVETSSGMWQPNWTRSRKLPVETPSSIHGREMVSALLVYR